VGVDEHSEEEDGGEGDEDVEAEWELRVEFVAAAPGREEAVARDRDEPEHEWE